jgi:hypothetical protein
MGTSESIVTMPPWRGWVPLVVLTIGVVALTPHQWPRWVMMWLMMFAVFAGLKWLSWRRTFVSGVSWRQHAAYLFAWPGLDAEAFLSRQQLPTTEQPSSWEWLSAGSKFLAGIGLFWGAKHLVPCGQEILLGWLGMIGVVLMFHFGSFHELSCAWRMAGVRAEPLMNHPFAAVRVSEFWGKRWNTAYRDVTYRFLFRPLSGRLGPRWAILVGFAFSALVHELVISMPAAAGYGGPTAFFMIQAAALFAERSRLGRAIGLGSGWIGWAFTMLMLALPAYWLFHPPFVLYVVVPFMRILDAA